MGLILIIVIYAIYFILKLVNPGFIVGIAELPGVVAFGNYVDAHPWAYYLFNGSMSFITYYIYCCACCRKRHLNYKECTIVLGVTILWYILSHFAPTLSIPFNYVSLIILPVIILIMSKDINEKHLSSIMTCFTIHSLLQYIST